jgi:hypothetical protein
VAWVRCGAEWREVADVQGFQVGIGIQVPRFASFAFRTFGHGLGTRGHLHSPS